MRYVGEPVAVVIAEDRYGAEDAAALVALEYDHLPAVVEAHRAQADDVVIHTARGTNVASTYTVSRGDPDGAFAAADYTRAETFRCQRHTAVPIETRARRCTWGESCARHLTGSSGAARR